MKSTILWLALALAAEMFTLGQGEQLEIGNVPIAQVSLQYQLNPHGPLVIENPISLNSKSGPFMLGPDGTLIGPFSQAEAGALLAPDFLSRLPAAQLETVAYPRSIFPVPFVPTLIAGDGLITINPNGPFGSFQDVVSSAASVVPEPSVLVIVLAALGMLSFKRCLGH
jgi:hypothetical protein